MIQSGHAIASPVAALFSNNISVSFRPKHLTCTTEGGITLCGAAGPTWFWEAQRDSRVKRRKTESAPPPGCLLLWQTVWWGNGWNGTYPEQRLRFSAVIVYVTFMSWVWIKKDSLALCNVSFKRLINQKPNTCQCVISIIATGGQQRPRER